eukprot:CAMPEP_0116941900 /NCGR_PEP_ID=MMETSP0467-20121206/34268_1 /TAXON_ID=283647 /ORGANISM="Mesodinium pulex, Strain SPMC105" /LENGTH=39 /DNA_ID= /DNA_START= /DNA_END= /DNA_ORIENTATION=
MMDIEEETLSEDIDLNKKNDSIHFNNQNLDIGNGNDSDS